MHPLIEQLRGKLIVSCRRISENPCAIPRPWPRLRVQPNWAAQPLFAAEGLSISRPSRAALNSCDRPVERGSRRRLYHAVRASCTCLHRCRFRYRGHRRDGSFRPDGSTFEDTVEAVRAETLVMADCACMDDVRRALAAGVDIVSTTMAGYAPGREKTDDFRISISCAKP